MGGCWPSHPPLRGLQARAGNGRCLTATVVQQGHYNVPMPEVPARELRNDVSAVLRRVEAGEHLRVTVSGRPVADLVPLSKRPRSIPWDAFIQRSDRWLADPGRPKSSRICCRTRPTTSRSHDRA